METPLSGSHLGPHTRPKRPCNKAVFREAVCSYVTPFNAACSSTNSESAPRSSTTNTNTACQEEEVPSVATVGDFKQFSHAAQFGAWIGLTPRQHSSGGKNSLGGITKRGDNYLRSLLIQGAKSAVMTAHKRSDPISQWAAALRERAGWQKAAVALANKNARILWAVMTKGQAFDPRHVSVKPGAATTMPIAPAATAA